MYIVDAHNEQERSWQQILGLGLVVLQTLLECEAVGMEAAEVEIGRTEVIEYWRLHVGTVC